VWYTALNTLCSDTLPNICRLQNSRKKCWKERWIACEDKIKWIGESWAQKQWGRSIKSCCCFFSLFCFVPDNFAFRASQFSLSHKKCNYLHYQLEHLVSTFWPHIVCMRFLPFQQQTAITSLNKTNLFVLVMKEQCVFCKVRTEVLKRDLEETSKEKM